MKKKALIPAAVILLAVVVAAVFYLAPKTFGENITPSEVDHINVFDGTTGVGFTIDNPDDIQYIVENIQSHPMKRDGVSLGHSGYGFQVSYLDENDEDVIPLFFLNSEDTIRKAPFFYRCDGGLCFDYLKTLEEAYSAK